MKVSISGVRGVFGDDLNLKDNVLMLGLREDIPRVLASADLYVIPSLSEGMGQSTMEALAMGVPVIASDVGGLPELIIDDQTGTLVPPKNVLALAKTIIGLLSDKEKSARLAERAKQSVINYYSIERTVDKTLNLYSELLK